MGQEQSKPTYREEKPRARAALPFSDLEDSVIVEKSGRSYDGRHGVLFFEIRFNTLQNPWSVR